MPETPDFEQLARRIADETGVARLEEWDAEDPDRVVSSFAEQLRLMWNARGAADIAMIEAAFAHPHPAVKTLDQAIRRLDR